MAAVAQIRELVILQAAAIVNMGKPLPLLGAANIDLEAAHKRLIDHLRREISDERVLDAMGGVDREFFVPEASRYLAYEDIPLPIGYGQTISQPFIVALMTEALSLKGWETVLEMGTGSGYQTAVLAKLAHRVVSVERVPELAAASERLLRTLGYANVEIHLAAQALGWPEGAPYHAIIVTAGAPMVPQELLDQLAVEGRMVIPVGSRYDQELMVITKGARGAAMRSLGGCRFVPLIGPGAWDE